MVGAPLLFAQQEQADKDKKGTLHRQRFKSLEKAVARAAVELDREHTFGVATLIYSARTPANDRFRGKVEFRSVGPTSHGYIGGTLSDGEYILQPTFVLRSTRPVELHIFVPGYERFVRRVILRTGDIVIWDDIVLEPLTGRNSGSIAGRVWLEDQDEGLGGMLISVDGEGLAFTDQKGYFAVEPVRTGRVNVLAQNKDYVGLSEVVDVVAGKQQPTLLVGHLARYARVRWAYQPNGTRAFDGELELGAAVLSARGLARPSFARGFKNVHAHSDFLVFQKEDELFLRHFDVANGRHPASMRLRESSFDVLREAPADGYDRVERRLRPGDLFVFRCYDGEHYAMMEVVDVTTKKPDARETTTGR